MLSLQDVHVHDEKINDVWERSNGSGGAASYIYRMQSITTAYVVKTPRQLRGELGELVNSSTISYIQAQ